MRLQEMYHLIHNALQNWQDPIFTQHGSAGSKDIVYAFENASNVVQLLEPLQVLPTIKQETEYIYGTSKKFKTGEIPYVSSRGCDTIEISMAKIRRDLQAMLDMCEALGVEPNQNGFDIKLPPDITLDELAECIKDLNTIFSKCPLLRKDGDQIELRGVDVGSSWLVFSVMGKYILDGIAALVDKAVQIRSHWITCKQQEEAARKAKISNDLLEVLVSTNNEIIQKMKENAIEELSKTNDITDPEDLARMDHSFDLLSKWINKGMEVYQAIDAPDEVKAAFPPVEQQELPEIAQKLLSEHTETEEEEETE